MESQPSGLPSAPYVDLEAAEKKARSAGNWFFVIAGLSLVNTAMAFTGSDRSFVLGLAVTQVADAFAKVMVERGGPASLHTLAIGFDVVVAGLFVAAGALARRRVVWTYLAGMVLYLLDALLCAALQVWMSLLFHGVALFYLWPGFAALRALRAAAAPPAPTNPLVR